MSVDYHLPPAFVRFVFIHIKDNYFYFFIIHYQRPMSRLRLNEATSPCV